MLLLLLLLLLLSSSSSLYVFLLALSCCNKPVQKVWARLYFPNIVSVRHEGFLTSCFNWLKKQQMDDQSKDVSPSLRASPPFGGVERIHTRAARGRRRQRILF